MINDKGTTLHDGFLNCAPLKHENHESFACCRVRSSQVPRRDCHFHACVEFDRLPLVKGSVAASIIGREGNRAVPTNEVDHPADVIAATPIVVAWRRFRYVD